MRLISIALALAYMFSTAAPVEATVSRNGPASWYCWPGQSICTRGYGWTGYQSSGGWVGYAAAGPALRVGNWRGRIVRVARTHTHIVNKREVKTTHVIRVKLIDWCSCPRGRLIDLYGTAFERLHLSRWRDGVGSVTITW